MWRKRISFLLLPTGLLMVGILMTPKTIQPSPTEEGFSIAVVYDNYRARPGLTTGWGFGCVIRTPTKKILFDTGGDSSILLSNMKMLNIGPQNIEIVVISHIHGDHLGGLGGFLEKNSRVTVYVPASFPDSIKEEIRLFGAECRSVEKAIPIVRNVFSTGEMGNWIKEQSIILDTPKGVIVITGCAHPGIVNIIKKAKEILPDKQIHLVMGGFHLGGVSDSKLRSIIKEFRNLGVEKVGPCHCSGDRCRELFAEEYAGDYVDMGVGRVMVFES
jgi:7,8-dihydropterin-6-yl-methyl-4-(beta-D-ribofuranosyl)aminobenzene 5'-phosphate synthase